MYLLGISGYYHDSAAALLKDGAIVAAAHEERFTRKKHDAGFPAQAVRYCLKEGGVSLADVAAVTFYDKPLAKFDRLLETYLSYAPSGFSSFIASMPVWIKQKMFLKSAIRKELRKIESSVELPRLLFTEHHQAHAASAFYPSPFAKAAVLCLDGVGEWASTSLWLGDGNRLTPQWEIQFPHSLGLLYSAFTYYAGFKVNSGEYKLMGLAPYGEPKYVKTIFDHLIDVKEDGTFRLNMKYFGFASGLRMTNREFEKLFGGPAREPEDLLTQREMDIAKSIQVVTEEIVLRLAKSIHAEFGSEYLCLAGGVALNCVANGRLLREGPFKDIWIQPAAGDAGGALGAAYATWHEYFGAARFPVQDDAMQGAYLGPRFANAEVRQTLHSLGAVYHQLPDDELLEKTAELLDGEKVVGWFQGRMEFGPRALGNRSILGDPRSPKMQSIMNLKIKHRESFRPFAPAVLESDVAEYFEMARPSPYMLVTANVKRELRIPMSDEQNQLFGIEKLNISRSTLPAITHLDYSARIQTVSEKTNPRFHRLISKFKERTGCGVLVNTSFNVRGEPIVGSIEDAYRCFMRTEMDYLVVENFLLAKGSQSPVSQGHGWQQEYELD